MVRSMVFSCQPVYLRLYLDISSRLNEGYRFFFLIGQLIRLLDPPVTEERCGKMDNCMYSTKDSGKHRIKVHCCESVCM